MASVIDNFKNRRADRIAPLDFSEIDKRQAKIEQQQGEARKRVLELEAAVGEIASTAPLSDEHRRLNKELQEAHENLHLLNQGFEGCKTERARMIERNTALNAAVLRKNCTGHIDAAEAAAKDVAEAVHAFVTAYQKLVVHARNAHRTVPMGAGKPDGLLAAGQLKLDIGVELFRLAAEKSGRSIGRDVVLLPVGSMSPDVMVEDNPAAIQPFIEKVRKQAQAFKTLIQEPAK